MAHVEHVECTDIVKKTIGGSKHVNVFVLQVTWSSKKNSRVGRPYTEFFDFRKTLQQEFKGKADIPDLPGIRSFDKGLFGHKDPKKKKKTIEDFCQAILKLPKDVSQSRQVTEFFEAEKSALRTIEIQPVESLEAITVQNDLVKQLRAHAHTDGAAKVQADRFPSIDGSHPAHTHHPLMRQSSENPDDAPVYIATSDYKKQRDNEIDLQKGAQVTVMQKDLAGWWFVLVEDEGEGWAPGSLLEPKDHRPDSTPPQHTAGKPALYQATQTQHGVNEDEVSYEKGDLVEVLEMRMDGWWSVRHNGKEGVMPAIHLEPVSTEKGQTKKLASSLYHHNSIYRKSSPPPRSIDGDVYAKVHKVSKGPDKPSSKKTGGLTYAEIAFESKPDADRGSRMRPVILGDSSRTQYTEVLPISLPEHKPHEAKATNGDTVDGPEGKPKRTPEANKHSYMNWKTKPPSSSYTNISLDNEIPMIEHTVFEVVADHVCPSLTNDRLSVKRGDFVQAEKVEATRVLCTPWVENSHVSQLKGWVPIEKLKKIYTADTGTGLPPGPSLPSPDPPVKPSPDKVRTSKVPDPPPKSPAEVKSTTPSDKNKKHHEAHLKQPWFIGKMSRVDCEELFQQHATDKNFVIRESTYRIGHYTLSVQYGNKLHHYPIVLTDEDKYYIGKHNFKNLVNVVSYYEKNPLMYDENDLPLSLGAPLVRKK